MANLLKGPEPNFYCEIILITHIRSLLARKQSSIWISRYRDRIQLQIRISGRHSDGRHRERFSLNTFSMPTISTPTFSKFLVGIRAVFGIKQSQCLPFPMPTLVGIATGRHSDR